MASGKTAVWDHLALDVPDYLHLLTGHYIVKGNKYSVHRQTGTGDWLFIATLSGSGRFGTGKQRLTVQAGELVLIRPGVRHDYGVAPEADGWELLWAHFHPRTHWHEWLIWPEHTAGLMHLNLAKNAQVWKDAYVSFRRTHQYASGTEQSSQDFAMNSLEKVVLHCHGLLLQHQSNLDERVQIVLHLINSRLAESLDIPFLAASVSLSPSRLSHLFREQIGTSPLQYMDLQRIQRSKHLLERTTSSISQIAEAVGLDPIYFSLRFKQHTGLSPRAYRNRR